MKPISVVIITKNEAVNIADCIKTAKQVSDDIIVADTGSSDNTVAIAEKEGVTVIKIGWKGYGNARNTAAEATKNDWILAIDADERITESLVASIKKIENEDAGVIYGFKRESYFLGKKIRFGNFGRDKVFRLYNKKTGSWDKAQVHEVLIGENISKQFVEGHLEHYTIRALEENDRKVYSYARLSAKKYFDKGKKATFIKRYLSPIAGFIQPYIFLLGFLDGKEGFIIAYSNAKCTWLKYKYLYELNKEKLKV